MNDADRPPVQRAAFFQRAVAYLIDGLLFVPVDLALVVAFGPNGSYLTVPLGLLYFAYLEGSPSGQTVGKRALGIRIVDARGSSSGIGFGRGLIRYLGKILSSLPLLLGFFWMLWDSEKQTWHDKIASTVVVPEAAMPVDRWPG